MENKVDIDTANGPAVVTEEVKLYVRALDIDIWASILPNSKVCLLSQGKLVEDHKLNYIHRHGR